MESSPFPHHGPLPAEQVRGRDGLVADLLERVTQRRVTALIGPRRFGKTSALRKVASTLESAGNTVVWVDLWACRSIADLVVRFDEGLDGTTNIQREVATALGFNFGVFKAEFAKPVSDRPDPDAALHLVLDALVEASKRQPTTLIVDEFTGIRAIAGAAGVLRTKIQHHIQELGVVFAGSEPTALAQMFTDRAEPFYAQADLLHIEPFSAAELTEIVERGFAESGRDAGALGARIHQYTGGHPHAAMRLASEAWRRTPAGAAADNRTWAEALGIAERDLELSMEAQFGSLSGSEQSTLRSIASGRALFGGSLDLFDVSSASVQSARDKLIADGTITRDLHIVDPFLLSWIRQRFAL